MTEPIHVLHFSDVHIGMESYGRTDPETGVSTRVRDFLRRMDEMIEYASARDVELTVFAGDAFKSATRPEKNPKLRLWTDDYSNLFQILRW